MDTLSAVEQAIFRWCKTDPVEFNTWLRDNGLAEAELGDSGVLFDADHPFLAMECKRRYPDLFATQH